MQDLLNTLASLTAILGPIAAILGLIQSRGWLTGLGTIVFGISIVAVVYARSQRLRIDAASVEIEGISIDSVNAANLRRRVNRSLVVQTADHFATIDGADLDMVWRYAGYCRARRETAMDFSVDSGNSTPFEDLDCFAYDLKRDPEKQHKIQPLLIGPDSISKKIAVPFLEPLLAQQPFDIMLHCRLPPRINLASGITHLRCHSTRTRSVAARFISRFCSGNPTGYVFTDPTFRDGRGSSRIFGQSARMRRRASIAM